MSASGAGSAIGPVLMRIDRSGVDTPRPAKSAILAELMKSTIASEVRKSLIMRSKRPSPRATATAPRSIGAMSAGFASLDGKAAF